MKTAITITDLALTQAEQLLSSAGFTFSHRTSVRSGWTGSTVLLRGLECGRIDPRCGPANPLTITIQAAYVDSDDLLALVRAGREFV